MTSITSKQQAPTIVMPVIEIVINTKRIFSVSVRRITKIQMSNPVKMDDTTIQICLCRSSAKMSLATSVWLMKMKTARILRLSNYL